MIELTDINVIFEQKKKQIHAVRDVNIRIARGEIFGIVGYSGAGKSTLVRVINLLQVPTTGSVKINNVEITKQSAKELRDTRHKIGMIFQHFNLMNARTIYDNVDFPLKYRKIPKAEREKKVNSLLELVGLADKAQAYPSQLSGGQKQRVAIARALANDPEILLCDEATSALDPKTTQQILALIKKVNEELGITVVLITHEMQAVKEVCHRVAIMENGHVIEENDIVTVFSNPQTPLAKDFIRTATHIEQAIETITTHPTLGQLEEDEEMLELAYVGASTSEPLINQLFAEFNVSTNILYGNVEIIQDTPIGSLIVIIKGSQPKRKLAKEYMLAQGVRVNRLDLEEEV